MTWKHAFFRSFAMLERMLVENLILQRKDALPYHSCVYVFLL